MYQVGVQARQKSRLLSNSGMLSLILILMLKTVTLHHLCKNRPLIFIYKENHPTNMKINH